jgi:mono/diheme cytochrome c family protein
MAQTRMGQMGGTSFIPASPRREPEMPNEALAGRDGLSPVMRKFLSLLRSQPDQASQALNQPFQLAGADLYRLNCRACHGADGKGAPPAINSLIGPVQGTSAARIQARMKARGAPISEGMAKDMAAQAEAALRDRLRKGGKKMPPFPHLRGDEIEALLGYLDELAGVPAGRRGHLLVSESAARVGEHMIKGTCHICHDATGPGGGHMAMMRGIIPSLASLPQDHSLSSVVRQVQYGSAGMMMMMGGPRMPPFPYFTEEEVAAAYFFLQQYPPQP